MCCNAFCVELGSNCTARWRYLRLCL